MKITVKGINKKEKTTGILDESGQWYNVWNFVKIDKKSVPNPLLAVLTKGNTVNVDITVSDDGKYHNITGLCYDDAHPEDKKSTPQIPKPTEHTYTPISNTDRIKIRSMAVSYVLEHLYPGCEPKTRTAALLATLTDEICSIIYEDEHYKQLVAKDKEEEIQF